MQRDPYLKLLFELRDVVHRIEEHLASSRVSKEDNTCCTSCAPEDGSAFMQTSGEELLFREGDRTRLDVSDSASSFFDNPTDPRTVEYARLHAPRLQQTFERIERIPNRENAVVLEIGAARFYRRRLESLFPSGHFVYSGKPLYGLASNATDRFVDFDLEKGMWPIEDGSIDFILCFEVLEHIFDDPMNILAEANRCLRLGGRFVLTTPNIASWRAIRAAITHYSPYLYMPFVPGLPKWESHRVEYTIRDIQEFSRAGGFTAQLDTFNSYAGSQDSELLRKIFEAYRFNTELRGDTIFAELKKISKVVDRFPKWFYSDYEDTYIKTGLVKL